MWKILKPNHGPLISYLICLALAGVLPQSASAQDSAQRIYKQASPAVFVVVLKDASGTATSFGSAFLIGKKTLVTNFHVIERGSVFLSLNSLDIPARVEKSDMVSDLAIIHVDADISANVLALSAQKASPGENVFVIGNPEGLENSISTGIVEATRQIDGRPLLQITAPISHGSSGGPVLNAAGEVIGVSVGMLKEGQNLNFAVPVEQLRTLLTSTGSDQVSVSGLMQQVKTLKDEQANQNKFADWEITKNRIVAILKTVLVQAGHNQELLLDIAEEARGEDSDLALSAAGAAVSLRSDARSNLIFGEALRDKAVDAASSNTSTFLELIIRAKQALQLSIKQTGKPSAEQYFNLGDVLEDLGSCKDAENNFINAIKANQVPFSDLFVESIRALARVTFSEKKVADSAAWFKVLNDRKLAMASDWIAEAKRRSQLGNYRQAGDAYTSLPACWAGAGLIGATVRARIQPPTITMKL